MVGDTEMVPITHFCSRRNSQTTEVALRFGEARLQTAPLSTGAAARYSHALYTHTGRYLIPNLSAVIPRSHLHPLAPFILPLHPTISFKIIFSVTPQPQTNTGKYRNLLFSKSPLFSNIYPHIPVAHSSSVIRKYPSS